MKNNQKSGTRVINSSLVGALSMWLLVLSYPRTLHADQATFEDYAAHGTRSFLEELNWAANQQLSIPTYFSAADATAIQTSVQAQLATVYTGFTVNFATANPGGAFTTVEFAPLDQSKPSGSFGSSPFDYRNQNAAGSTTVYTYNFGFALTGVKATDITRMSTALAGTAAHELAHSFGLDHRVTYGDRRITPAAYANTSSFQNQHIMATGSPGNLTGISAAERATPRTFSTMELAQLQFGNNLTASPAPTVVDAGAGHDTWLTAQYLSMNYLPLSQSSGANVRSGHLGAGEVDYYSFTATAGDSFTATVWSFTDDTFTPPSLMFASPVDTKLTLYRLTGKILTEVVQTSDTFYRGNVFNSGDVNDRESPDPFLLNITLPGNGTETYFLTVGGGGHLPYRRL
jgi:hypothetical protein